MTSRIFLFAAMIGLGACAAGAPSDEEVAGKLKAVTAQAITASDPSAIEIESPERFAAKWQWRATHAGKSYACDADNQMRLPSCTAIDT